MSHSDSVSIASQLLHLFEKYSNKNSLLHLLLFEKKWAITTVNFKKFSSVMFVDLKYVDLQH